MRIVSAMRGLAFYRKLHDEATPPRLVVADANERMVVGKDRRDDRKAETGALFFRREIGLEEPRLHFRRHARSVVRELEANEAERLQIGGRDLDRRACAESWIGVRGFLISWAIRCATSRHASMRCAFRICVMSSKNSTAPVAASGLAAGSRSGAAAASSVRPSSACTTSTCRSPCV